MILITSTSSSTSSAPQIHMMDSVNDTTPVSVKLYSTSGISLDVKDKCVDTGRKPVFLTYKDYTYILGQFAPNVLVAPEGFGYIMGIAPPATAPVVTTSGTGITGTAVCYITFVRRHPTSNRVIHESSPSPGFTVVLTNQGRSWGTLPVITDLGITHLRGYVSMDGAAPRRAWEREVGVTTVVENLATLSLGSTLKFDRDPPPYGSIGAVYHDRLWLVDPNDTTKLWFSKQFEPESFTPLNFISLLDGERITALHKHGDVLLVFSRNCTYALTGWSVDDFVFRKINPTIGCISHYSIVDIYGDTWFASKDGVIAYNGGFRNLMEDVNTGGWRVEYDSSSTTRTAYENSQAVIDEQRRAYKLHIPVPNAYYWVGFFEAMYAGETTQPDWTFDIRNRTDTCQGLLRQANSALDIVYTGSTDGFVRRENVTTNFNDDGDSFNMKMQVIFKHFLMGDPGGAIFDGKMFTELWTYVQAENSAWYLALYGGDEYANDFTAPAQWDDDVAASAVANKPPKTVHYHKPTKVSGRGLTVRIEASTPNAVKVRGFGGKYGPGTTGRHGT